MPSMLVVSPVTVESMDLRVMMPTNSPLALNMGPPELPGLTAASVWIKVWVALLSTISRFRPLTMPLETLLANRPLYGLPMTKTVSPSLRLLEEPNLTGVRPVLSIFKMARSL